MPLERSVADHVESIGECLVLKNKKNKKVEFECALLNNVETNGLPNYTEKY